MLGRFLLKSLSVVLPLILMAMPCDSLADDRDPHDLGFIKGFSWGWVGKRGEYASPAAAESMEKLAETGAEWVCIAFSANMVAPDNPDFSWGAENQFMVTDDEIRGAIDLARQNNLKVILKPVVNIQDGTWRAWIKFFRPVKPEERAGGITGEMDPWGDEVVMREGEVKDLAKWSRWWENFEGFVIHYAKIAAEKDVPILCLGCEMSSTEEFEDRWRHLIADVRQAYHGFITYNINHTREAQLTWWDAVDFISVSGYYAVTPPHGRSMEEAVKETTPKAEIVNELLRVKAQLALASEKWSKPILFIETGVTNVRGCARYPWSHPDARMDSPLDEDEQANYYAALFEVFWDEPWFMGFAWWDWPAELYDEMDAEMDRGFCVYGKKAAGVVHKWYAKPARPGIAD